MVVGVCGLKIEVNISLNLGDIISSWITTLSFFFFFKYQGAHCLNELYLDLLIRNQWF